MSTHLYYVYIYIYTSYIIHSSLAIILRVPFHAYAFYPDAHLHFHTPRSAIHISTYICVMYIEYVNVYISYVLYIYLHIIHDTLTTGYNTTCSIRHAVRYMYPRISVLCISHISTHIYILCMYIYTSYITHSSRAMILRVPFHAYAF